MFVATLPYLIARPDPYDKAVGNANFVVEGVLQRDRARGLAACGRSSATWVTSWGSTWCRARCVGSSRPGHGARAWCDRRIVHAHRQPVALGGQHRCARRARPAVDEVRDPRRDGTACGSPTARGSPRARLPVGSNDMAVVGWATDLDAPTESMVMLVAVNGKLAGAVWANGPRPDVAALIGITPDHGFGGVRVGPDEAVQRLRLRGQREDPLGLVPRLPGRQSIGPASSVSPASCASGRPTTLW